GALGRRRQRADLVGRISRDRHGVEPHRAPSRPRDGAHVGAEHGVRVARGGGGRSVRVRRGEWEREPQEGRRAGARFLPVATGRRRLPALFTLPFTCVSAIANPRVARCSESLSVHDTQRSDRAWSETLDIPVAGAVRYDGLSDRLPTRTEDMPARIVLTYRDYDALPADGRRDELHDGELLVTAAPSGSHQRVVGRSFALLRPPAEAPARGCG